MLQKKIERKRTRGRQQYNWKDNIGRWTFCILSLCSVKRQRVLNFHSSQPSFWIWSLFDWLIDDHIHSYSLSTPCGGRDLDYGRVGVGGGVVPMLPSCMLQKKTKGRFCSGSATQTCKEICTSYRNTDERNQTSHHVRGDGDRDKNALYEVLRPGSTGSSDSKSAFSSSLQLVKNVVVWT